MMFDGSGFDTTQDSDTRDQIRHKSRGSIIQVQNGWPFSAGTLALFGLA